MIGNCSIKGTSTLSSEANISIGNSSRWRTQFWVHPHTPQCSEVATAKYGFKTIQPTANGRQHYVLTTGGTYFTSESCKSPKEEMIHDMYHPVASPTSPVCRTLARASGT
ncbi:ASN_HP2_G0013520.mRNA.1.CDS.1 [Saccharomyces cerevisiae]|nr:ASN_HP2_G0013520.mRNA.1.CDS.1 [Saccharomyces cerevisiae]CAI6538934.1 ASN_HP2_G0013520.mRNA.1.CDS.1 [Saccharomyces cerevisiae]